MPTRFRCAARMTWCRSTSASACAAASTVASCRSDNRNDSGDCLTSWANPRWTVLNDFSIAYDFLEKWTFTVELQFLNSLASRLNESDVGSLTAGQNGAPIVVGSGL